MGLDLGLYFTQKRRGGGEFTKLFYDLGLDDKQIILAIMEDVGLLDHPAVQTRAANALLMHTKGEEYPVSGIKRLSKAAKEADAKNDA